MIEQSKIKAATFYFLSNNSTMLPEIGMEELRKKPKQTQKTQTNNQSTPCNKQIPAKDKHRTTTLKKTCKG